MRGWRAGDRHIIWSERVWIHRRGAGRCVTVVADNYAITKDTVTHMAERAKKAGAAAAATSDETAAA